MLQHCSHKFCHTPCQSPPSSTTLPLHRSILIHGLPLATMRVSCTGICRKCSAKKGSGSASSATASVPLKTVASRWTVLLYAAPRLRAYSTFRTASHQYHQPCRLVLAQCLQLWLMGRHKTNQQQAAHLWQVAEEQAAQLIVHPVHWAGRRQRLQRRYTRVDDGLRHRATTVILSSR